MDLRIPPGTQPGDTVKLYRKGVPDTDRPSVRGDHCFEVKVLIPKNLRFVSLSTSLVSLSLSCLKLCLLKC